MLSSFPMARLQTFPRTLGGTPCHQRSRTRRVLCLCDGNRAHHCKTLKNINESPLCIYGWDTYMLSQLGRTSMFQITMALAMLSSCRYRSFIWRFFFCASFISKQNKINCVCVWIGSERGQLCAEIQGRMANISSVKHHYHCKCSNECAQRHTHYSPFLLAPATISLYSCRCLWDSSSDLAGRFLKIQEVFEPVQTYIPFIQIYTTGKVWGSVWFFSCVTERSLLCSPMWK